MLVQAEPGSKERQDEGQQVHLGNSPTWGNVGISPEYLGITDGAGQAGWRGDIGCGSPRMLPSCTRGCWTGGWHGWQEGSGALRAAGVDLEIAKNLAWRRAGGQRASLAAEGSTALLRNGALFPCAQLGEATAVCSGSSVSVLDPLVLRGGMPITPSRGIAG